VAMTKKQELPDWSRRNLERVVVLLEFDAMEVKEPLAPKQHGNVRPMNMTGASNSSVWCSMRKVRSAMKPSIGSIGHPERSPAGARSAVDAEGVRDGGRHHDLICTRIDKRKKSTLVGAF